MKCECIESLITCNREIEFVYNRKRYSITYFRKKDGSKGISFCEFYKKPIDVNNTAELLKIKIGSRTLQQIMRNLPDNAFDIF